MLRAAKIISGFLCLCVVFASILWFTPVTSANTYTSVTPDPAPIASLRNERRAVMSDGSGSDTRLGASSQGNRDLLNNPHPAFTPHVYYRNKVVVVTFHDISPNLYSEFVITPQAFSADLDVFQKQFNVITNRQFIDFLNGRASVPPNAVLLTFDDGYQNMYTYATPILVKHHMQGTFFDIVSKADMNHPTEFLTWGEIESMSAQGMCIESHTYKLHREIHTPSGFPVAVFNTRIRVNGVIETPSQYYRRVYSDFSRAREELTQHTGIPADEFAWPYGHGTLMAVYIAHKAGYKYLFTTRNGFVGPHSNPLQIDRIDVGVTEESPSQAVHDVVAIATRPPEVYRVLHQMTRNVLGSTHL